MSNFEQAMTANAISSGKNDPPETDLDYYSMPENYTGSNLQAMQRFKFAKDKQDREHDKNKLKKPKKKEGFDLLARYKHILKGLVEDGDDESSSSEEDEDDDATKRDMEMSSRNDCVIIAPSLADICEDVEDELALGTKEYSPETAEQETPSPKLEENQQSATAVDIKRDSLSPDAQRGSSLKIMDSPSSFEWTGSPRSGMDLADSPTDSGCSSKRKSTMSQSRANYIMKKDLEKEIRSKMVSMVYNCL